MDNFNTPINNQIEQTAAPKKFSAAKIVFAILGIIILIEVIIAVKTLTAPVPIASPTISSIPKVNIKKTPAKISLIVSKTSFKVSETIPVSVLIDTGLNNVSGVDLIVHYDPKILDATNESLVKGNILDEYPLLSVDSKKGLISISGVSHVKKSFNGTGQFALINLKAKKLGKTSLLIDFKPGTTSASNLVEATTSKNILEKVDNLDLNIQ